MRRLLSHLSACALGTFLLGLAGCATQPPLPALPPSSTTESLPPAPVADKPIPKRKKPTTLPTRPINVKVDCRFRDETGYGGRLDLEVADAVVRRFGAQVDIPRRGVCRFDLAGFRQTRSMPTPILSDKHGKCQVRIWEQEEQVTVAFIACAAHCSRGAVDYLWPILVDRPGSQCY